MTTEGSDVILARMMSLHPKIIDLTLDRVWRLLGALGNPQEALPPPSVPPEAHARPTPPFARSPLLGPSARLEPEAPSSSDLKKREATAS